MTPRKWTTVTCALLLVGLGCSRSPAPTEPASSKEPGASKLKAETKHPMLGTWTYASITAKGKEVPDDRKKKAVMITETSIDLGDGTKATNIKLDPAGPGTLDIEAVEDKAATRFGLAGGPTVTIHYEGSAKAHKAAIYRIEGDKLTIRFDLEGDERPKWDTPGPNEVTLALKKASPSEVISKDDKVDASRIKPLKQWSGPVEDDKWRSVVSKSAGGDLKVALPGLVLTSADHLKKVYMDLDITAAVPEIDFAKQCAVILQEPEDASSLDSVAVDGDKRVKEVHYLGKEGQKEKSRYILASFPRDQVRSVGPATKDD